MATLKKIITSFDTACEQMIASDKPLQLRLDDAIKEISLFEAKDFNADLKKGFIPLLENIRAFQAIKYRQDLQAEAARAIFRMCLLLHSETWI